MKHLLLIAVLGFTVPVWAQTDMTATLETVAATLANVGLGTPQSDFFQAKTGLAQTSSDAIKFRTEVEEKVGKDGLKSVTYYFDDEGVKALYEIILEFNDLATREAAVAEMLGPSNYPDKPDYWIAGAEDNVVSIAWVFQNKMIVAVNLPGTEWENDPNFKIPAGFEMNKILPKPSEWGQQDLNEFFASLEVQLEAGAKAFESIKGTESDGFFECTRPLHGAEAAAVLLSDSGKWLASNTLFSGASQPTAEAWRTDMENTISTHVFAGYRLSRAGTANEFGATVSLWDVADAQNKPLGLQIGVLHYEWSAEGLYSLDVQVRQK